MKGIEYADRQISKALQDGRITPEDAELISEFINELKATVQISAGRAYKLQYLLVGWRSFLPPFRDVDTKSVLEGIERIKTAKTDKGTPL
jgi:hypothetical protein